jgi:hypothetical protein
MKNWAAVSSKVVALVAMSACASGPVRSSDLSAFDVIAIAPAIASTANVVAHAELAPLQEASIEEALRQLRPEWLRVNPSSRRVAEPARASVYVNDVYAGELETLRLIPVSAVIDARFLAPSAARDQFGPGCRCAAGIILIATRRKHEGGA